VCLFIIHGWKHRFYPKDSKVFDQRSDMAMFVFLKGHSSLVWKKGFVSPVFPKLQPFKLLTLFDNMDENLENIIVSETRQTRKDKNCMVSFICGI
jgi:spore cortex formation protein SpoVR/YcgB (stage V sporulation)